MGKIPVGLARTELVNISFEGKSSYEIVTLRCLTLTCCRFSRFCMIQYLRHDTVLDEGRLVGVSVVKEGLLFIRFPHED